MSGWSSSSSLGSEIFRRINILVRRLGMFYTIYKTTNRINGKFYIGKHQTKNPNDSYYGSGKKLELAIKKYGKENFTKEILFIFNNEEEMNAKEKEIITEEFVSRRDTYNVGVGGEGGPHFKGKKHSAESKAKMLRKDYTHSAETRAKLSEANRKRVLSEETRKKLSEKAKLRRLNPEYKQRISESMKNIICCGQVVRRPF
jgi:hypothetical protein